MIQSIIGYALDWLSLHLASIVTTAISALLIALREKWAPSKALDGIDVSKLPAAPDNADGVPK